MSGELTGKVAVVTGGASGLGEGLARRFAAEGAKVVIGDVDRDGGKALAAELGADALFVESDVADFDQVAKLVSTAVEHYGGLHVMINNAGVSGTMHRRFMDDDLADFHKVMAINVGAVMAGTRDAARHMSEQIGSTVRLYKNNTDFLGHSYGCHENYLLPRSLPWENLANGIQAYLVTRQIFAGAGKFAIEAEDKFVSPGFQIAQRSDFFSELQSVDTMQRRPIINTRDEPHANAQRFRRFHVIIGDANMSPFATRSALVTKRTSSASDGTPAATQNLRH